VIDAKTQGAASIRLLATGASVQAEIVESNQSVHLPSMPGKELVA
jgi:hypothetical protein